MESRSTIAPLLRHQPRSKGGLSHISLASQPQPQLQPQPQPRLEKQKRRVSWRHCTANISLPSSARRTVRNWWLELLACILLVVATSGLIAVLRDYDGRPIPQWPLGFSINAALSLFGVAFRAPVLFIAAEGIGQLKWHWLSQRHPLSDLTTYDEASRGPWGSVKLLWVARWRDLLGFVGAVITVAALGIDPFTQAIVGYYDCTADAPDAISTISHINSYFSRGTGDDLPVLARISVESSFHDQGSLLPSYICSADRCDFSDPYHSIGLCSQCVDVTDELQTSCTGFGEGCNYTLTEHYPRNRTVNTTARYTTGGSVEFNQRIGAFEVFSITKYKDIANDDGIMVPLGAEGPSYQSSTIDMVSAWPVLAFRCTLSYCVRTYTATIDHGVLREVLQSTSNNWSECSDVTQVIGMVEVDCLSSEVQARLSMENYISSETNWMAWNGTYLNGTEQDENISDKQELAIPVACIYQAQILGSSFSWDPRESFSDVLSGTVEGTGWGTLIDETWKNVSINLFPSAPSLLSWLWRNATLSVDSINEAFSNFTTGASNHMRSGPSQPIPKNITNLLPTYVSNPFLPLNAVPGNLEDWNQPVHGSALVDTTCIRVRWAWIALPATIFASTLLFFAALVARTSHERGCEVWKSSQNALIWHGLDGPAIDESGLLITKKDMDQRARQLEVHLSKTRLGWSIVQDLKSGNKSRD